MPETYQKYTLPDLWKMVADEDPETGFTHVNTLNRLRTALEQQRDILRARRDRLIEAWPPDRSEAAAAFVTRINDMLTAMTYTTDAAARICVGVDEVFAAIREARRQLESLMADYTKRGAGMGPVMPTSNHPELDQHGRNTLVAADAKVVGASRMIETSVPPYYRLKESATDILTTDDESASGSGSTGGTAGLGDGRGSAVLRPPVFNPPSPSVSTAGYPAAEGSDTLSPGTGPELAGDAAVAASPTGGGGSIAYPPQHSSEPFGVTPISGQPGANDIVPFRPGAVGPGGVIGATHPSSPVGSQFTGGPITGTKSPTARRRPAVSPEPRELRRANDLRGEYQDKSYEAYAERRRSQRGHDDDPWSVDQGVPPILEALTERSHDPGPGVLGIDR